MSSRKGRPLIWTDQKIAELRRTMEPWMYERTATHFQFGLRDLVMEFRVSDDVAAKIVQACITDGIVVYRGATHLGYAWLGAAGKAVTLANLMTLAGDRVDPDAAAEKGRRAPAVRLLTPSQYKDIKTVANMIAKCVPGANGDFAKVTSTWFGFDKERACWELEAHVERWSDEQHRIRWEQHAATDGVPGAVWTPKLNAGRSKHLGAIQNLLDLAATHGSIRRTARPEHNLRHPATEWKRFMTRWKRRILKHDAAASPAMLDVGLRILALMATRRRELSPTTTDWMAVRAEIEARVELDPGDRYVHQQRDCARYVWRRVMSLLARRSGPRSRVRVVFASEHHWETRQDTRRSLVPDGAIVAAASFAAGRTSESSTGRRLRRGRRLDASSSSDGSSSCAPTDTFDFAATWTARGGQYARSMVEGDRGLARWITFSTAPADTLQRLGFPAREFIDPTPEITRGLRRATGKDKVPYLLGYDTLVGRLRQISQLAGFAHDNPDACTELVGRSYDFTERDDLGSICDMKLILAYSEWLREEADDEEEDSRNDESMEGVSPTVATLAINLSKVASPFLEGSALRRAARLEESGDAPGAADARVEAAHFRAVGAELKRWGYKYKPRENTRKDIIEIADAWKGSDHRAGWLKLGDLVELLCTEAECAAGMTIEQQLAVMSRAETAATPRERAELLAWQSPTWAAAVRAAMLVNFVRKLPLRARAVSEMRLDWWQATVEGQRVEPWRRDAAVMVDVPAFAMKTKERDYRAPYIRPECVGNRDFEAGAHRDLVELYLRPTGARAYLITEWVEQDMPIGVGETALVRIASATIASPYLFPGSAMRGNGGRGAPRQLRKATGLRWNSASISTHFEQLVREHAAEMKLDLGVLDAHHGGLRLHVVRLLYGSHFAPTNLTDASLMLHHADVATTSLLYVGRSAAQAALEATREERSRGPSPESDAAALRQALTEQATANTELRRQNEELLGRIDALLQRQTEMMRAFGQAA